jgi:thioredoxin reductase/Pyruvate/2-oxoacid:ferredoxin oxidoreductase delta subunit
MFDHFLFVGFYGLVLLVPVGVYLRRHVRRERRAREAAAAGELFSEAPLGQHPQIDVTHCIGCQGCTVACPEGQVLGMVAGKAAVVKPHRCIGHGLCADACPVGAIKLVRANPGTSARLPRLTHEYETSVPNLYIAGELGGLALIKNAVNQGRECIDTIAARCGGGDPGQGVYQVVIVGAGPAGISASLRAIERGLKYVTIERETLGGSIAKYPRQKLVMTSPIEFPLNARLKKLQLSKENLLEFWQRLCDREDFHVRLNEPVESIRRDPAGVFTVKTPSVEYHAQAVVLAMGRSGIPRKLGIKGEDLPKVMYRLMEANHYVNKRILVVGGGDSAVEAALGLAMQKGNQVRLSYRKSAFTRLKERNIQRLTKVIAEGRLNVIYESAPVEIRADSVVLDVAGAQVEIANDYVWVFAGGLAPDDFLRSVGIEYGPRDLTAQVVQEAAMAKPAAAGG